MNADTLEAVERAVYARLEDDDLSKGERGRLLALVKAASGVRADLVRFEAKTRMKALREADAAGELPVREAPVNAAAVNGRPPMLADRK